MIVVEHDEDMIRAADYVVDIGPARACTAAHHWPKARPMTLAPTPIGITGKYLAGRRASIACPAARHDGRRAARGAGRGHNLKTSRRDPGGLFTCVTGVSGSGKSTWSTTRLYAAVAKSVPRRRTWPGATRSRAWSMFDKVINVDQSPIGRTPRSNPATYTGLFTAIRELFAGVPTARSAAMGPGRFSFNVAGGRCEACQGDGVIKVEMHFLPDVYVPCDVCHGKRYNRETLDVQYKGKNIHEVLNLTVEDALAFFSAVPSIARKLQN